MYCIKLLSYFRKSPKCKLTCSVFHSLNNGESKVKEMDKTDLLDPPRDLHGMKVLDRDAFRKTITVPCLDVENRCLKVLTPILKKYYLKIMRLKGLREGNDKQKILLNPCLINSWSDFDEQVQVKLKEFDISEVNFSKMCVELGYENWPAAPLLKAVLPKDEPPLTSYSIIGHIIHLNIKEHLYEYRHVIADILLDKVQSARTVVCKKNIIDNVYRNFEMELLRGEPDYIACVKEHGTTFKFDFSKVYWNPRLSTEHGRIVDILQKGDVLFDVFAGVGPFAIPAAKKMCITHANDLNPESYKWLNHNITLNKKSQKYIVTYNKDGGDFLKTDGKQNLIKTWQNPEFSGKIHFIMNLPASALSFIKHFKGLIARDDVDVTKVEKCLPIIHCHFFVKEPETPANVFEQVTEISLKDVEHNFHSVRNVSNGKTMMRITFTIPMNYLLSDNEYGEPSEKKIRTE